ncbi:MAG: ABC transporter ATP-binding protein [Deltaproteobacteria bacterium]|jgi:lipoprotein-releasing system ATP-binding protein|nr:MAG: ABC transporter ATP-binding protein [Deltaproteobacteria bacterium]
MNSTGLNSTGFLRVENLHKEFPKRGGPVEVLKGITFTLDRGEMLGVVGVSGAGKTTLLQIVGTLDRATSGSVFYDGRDVTSMPEGMLAEFRNRNVGFVFQFHHLLSEFDARENVMLPCLIAGMARDMAMKRAEDLLSEVGLSERFTHRVGELSGGELQRVAICRALVMGPEILLADEPTGNLDKETARGVAQLLGDLNRKKGLSLVIVTHNEELAGRMHRVLKIDDGIVR